MIKLGFGFLTGRSPNNGYASWSSSRTKQTTRKLPITNHSLTGWFRRCTAHEYWIRTQYQNPVNRMFVRWKRTAIGLPSAKQGDLFHNVDAALKFVSPLSA